MPEWITVTPWWVPVSVIAAMVGIGVVIFKSGTWVGGVNTNLQSFKDAVSEIKEGVTKIRDDINGLLHETTSKTLNPGSPLEPNELGKKVSDTIGVPSIVKGLAPGLRAKAEG